MNYLTKDDWNTFLQKISDDNSFIKQFKSMAKVHNNILFIFQKITPQKNNNLSLKEKVTLNNSQQKVFTTSLFFYHKYNLKEDLLSKELSPSEQCLIYSACIFLGLKVFHLPKNVNGLSKIIQPYILSSSGNKLEISEIKELIFQKEFDILLSIGFDVNIDLPYQFIYTFKTYLQKLNYTNSRIDGLIKLLLIYINDSIIFPIFLYYPPNVIAISCILLIKEKLEIDEINIDELMKLSNYYIDMDSIRECSLLIKKIILTKDNLAKIKTNNTQITAKSNLNDTKSKNIITNFISSIKSNRD